MTPQERAYGQVVKLAWDFIENKVPLESNGLKVYLVHSTFDPSTLRGTDWPHNPAGLYAMFVDSAWRTMPIPAVRWRSIGCARCSITSWHTARPRQRTAGIGIVRQG